MSEKMKKPPKGMEQSVQDGKKRRFAPAEGNSFGRGPGPRGSGKPKPKVKDAKGTILRLFKYLAGVKWELIFALLALVLSTITGLITPKISGNIINILNEGKGSLSKAQSAALTFGTYFAAASMLRRLRGQKLRGQMW